MVEMLNKLEFMLMGLRQMNLNAVCAWFTNMKREDILKALEESPKFKIEGNIVSLKSETELYEEELQKDILKDLMGDVDSEDEDEFSDYDDDLEIIEAVEEAPKLVEEINLDDNMVVFNEDTQNVIEENIDLDNIVDSLWVEAKEPEEEIEVQEINFDEVEDILTPIETMVEEETSSQEETYSVENKDYFDYYYNKNNKEEEQEIVKVEEEVVEKVIEKVVEVTDTSKVKGSDIPYEELIRLIEEYNETIEDKINYASEHNFEVKVKAIKSFYENKYNVRLKENTILDTNACVFALIHKKKGMEVAYLVVCDTLSDEVLNYMLDHYDEEVVYFCPVNGSEVEFEVGLNEFYLKDTGIIFDKFLEHYVVVEECDVKVKKLEVIIGNS